MHYFVFFAEATFTLTCIIFIDCLSSLATVCLVMRKNSFRCVCLCSLLCYLLGNILFSGLIASSCPPIHLFMRLTCALVSGGPNLELAYLHMCGKYRSWLVKFHSYLTSVQSILSFSKFCASTDSFCTS